MTYQPISGRLESCNSATVESCWSRVESSMPSLAVIPRRKPRDPAVLRAASDLWRSAPFVHSSSFVIRHSSFGRFVPSTPQPSTNTPQPFWPLAKISFPRPCPFTTIPVVRYARNKRQIDHGRQHVLNTVGETSVRLGPSVSRREMKRLLSGVEAEGDRIIQILSAFNCRFLGPNTR